MVTGPCGAHPSPSQPPDSWDDEFNMVSNHGLSFAEADSECDTLVNSSIPVFAEEGLGYEVPCPMNTSMYDFFSKTPVSWAFTSLDGAPDDDMPEPTDGPQNSLALPQPGWNSVRVIGSGALKVFWGFNSGGNILLPQQWKAIYSPGASVVPPTSRT